MPPGHVTCLPAASFFFLLSPEIDPIRAFFFALFWPFFNPLSPFRWLLLLAIDAVVLAALTIAKCCFDDQPANDLSTPLSLRHYSPIAEPVHPLRNGLCPICCRYSPTEALFYPDISSNQRRDRHFLSDFLLLFLVHFFFFRLPSFLHIQRQKSRESGVRQRYSHCGHTTEKGKRCVATTPWAWTRSPNIS